MAAPARKRKMVTISPKVIVLGIIAVGATWLAAQRVFFAPTPAERIEHLLQGAAKAAEAKSIIRLSDVFTYDYQDASGADRSAVLGHARQFFAEADKIRAEIVRVLHENPKLAREATKARAIVIVRLSGVENTGGEKFSGIAGPGGDAFEVSLRRSKGTWKIARSRRLSGTNPRELMRELRSGEE